MRKFTLIFLVIISILIYINNKEEVKEIRVRVVPNSDSEVDLLVKEDVKNITVSYLKEAYDSNYNIYIDNIRYGLLYLEEVIEENSKEEVLITFDNHTLYNKTYNNNVIENTEELTLCIKIGNGNGSNWWGTIYPEFLMINSSEVVEYESLFVNLFKKIGDTQDD